MRLTLIFVVIFAAYALAQVRKKEHNGKLYIASNSKLKYNEAKRFCSNNEAILVKVRSLDESQWIVSHMLDGYSPYWIGAMKRNGTYVWADGEDIVWTNWNGGNPEYCTEHCCKVLVRASTLQWYRRHCGFFASFYAVCQSNSTILMDKYRNETVGISTTEAVSISSSLDTVGKRGDVAAGYETVDMVAFALETFQAKAESKDSELGVEIDGLTERLRAMNVSISLQREEFADKDIALSVTMDDLARSVQDTNSAISSLRGSRKIQIQIWTLAGVLLVTIVFGTAALLILRRKIIVIREGGYSYQFKNFSQSRNSTLRSELAPY